MTAGVSQGDVSNVAPAAPDPVEQRYRLLLEHSPDPMCVHADGRVVYVNPAGVTGIAARSAEDLVGRMITDFVHPDSLASMLDRITALHRQGDSSPPSEAVMLRLDGSPVDAEVVSVLTSWDGKPAYQVIFRDLTIIKAAQATLRLQAALVAHATEAIIATTISGVVTSWNTAAETIYRRPAARALTLPIREAVGAVVDPAAIIAQGGVEHATHYAADGTARTVRVAAAAMTEGYVLVCSDYTALRRAERRFHTVVNSLDEGVVVLDARGFLEWINPAARHLLGLPPDGTLPDYADPTVFPLLDGDGTPLGVGQRQFARILSTGVAVRDQIMAYDRPDGTRRWLCVSYRPLDDADTGPPGLLITFTDVTDQRHERSRLDHQAHHDALTGLPNRAHAEARITRALRTGSPVLNALLFIDLDNTKTINDAFGHHAGDAVIITAARRLRSALRTEDFIARHGGDEFVALLFGHTDHAVVHHLTERLHAALATPMVVAGVPHRLTASIGVTQVTPGDPRDAAQMVRDADTAMYAAKTHRGTTHYHVG